MSNGIHTCENYAILRTGKAAMGGTNIDTFGDMRALVKQAFRIYVVDSLKAESYALLTDLEKVVVEEIDAWLPDIKP